MTPPLYVRLFFYLILGALSTLFAEVTIGSSVYPFFKVQGWVITIPVYLLHIILLSAIVYRYGRPTFETLYSAGVIFGLYEAYITKVLWDPPWGSLGWDLFADICLVPFLVISSAWHPYLAFMAPLFVANRYLTRGDDFPVLPFFAPSKKLTAVLFVSFALMSSNAIQPGPMIYSPLVSSLFVVMLCALWLHFVGQRYTLTELLPKGSALIFWLLALIALQITAGIFIRPEALPKDFLGHASVSTLYQIFGLTLAVTLRRSTYYPTAKTDPAQRINWPKFLGAVFIFNLISIASVYLISIRAFIPMIVTLLGAAIALLSFFALFKSLLRHVQFRGT